MDDITYELYQRILALTAMNEEPRGILFAKMTPEAEGEEGERRFADALAFYKAHKGNPPPMFHFTQAELDALIFRYPISVPPELQNGVA